MSFMRTGAMTAILYWKEESNLPNFYTITAIASCDNGICIRCMSCLPVPVSARSKA